MKTGRVAQHVWKVAPPDIPVVGGQQVCGTDDAFIVGFILKRNRSKGWVQSLFSQK